MHPIRPLFFLLPCFALALAGCGRENRSTGEKPETAHVPKAGEQKVVLSVEGMH